MKKSYKKIGRIIRVITFPIPLILGLIGYGYVGGLSLVDAFYSSAALYFVNPISDLSNVYVILAEVGALFVAVGVVAQAITALYSLLKKSPFRFFTSKTVIYSDSELGEELYNNWPKSILVNRGMRALRAKEHVIMFDDDLENLKFLHDNMDELKKKNRKVYLLLNELDPLLLKEDKEMDISFFNIYDIIASDYWMKKKLYDRPQWNIAILGYGNLGKAMFRHAYLIELFSLNQKITYHIYGADGDEKEFLSNLKFMNEDSVVVHDEPYESQYREIAGMDLVLYTESKGTVEAVQSLLRYNSQLDIAYYTEDETLLTEVLNAGSLCSFGETNKLLTQDTIQRRKIYIQAMLFNYDYTCLVNGYKTLPDNFMDEAYALWRESNGFFQGTNIYKAEQYGIRKYLKDNGICTADELKELEHTRWARYYYYNGWSYAKERDNANKKHNNLVPYSELPKGVDDKDGIQNPELERKIDSLTEEI